LSLYHIQWRPLASTKSLLTIRKEHNERSRFCLTTSLLTSCPTPLSGSTSRLNWFLEIEYPTLNTCCNRLQHARKPLSKPVAQPRPIGSSFGCQIREGCVLEGSTGGFLCRAGQGWTRTHRRLAAWRYTSGNWEDDPSVSGICIRFLLFLFLESVHFVLF
jgi:hypothetical protein